MVTISNSDLSDYESLGIESINSDALIIDVTTSRWTLSGSFYSPFIGCFLTYNLINYYSFGLLELLFLLLGIVGRYLVSKHRKKIFNKTKKIFLKRIKFDRVTGSIVYESFSKKKKQFDFSEIQLGKKDVICVSSFKATLFYFKDKNNKTYTIGQLPNYHYRYLDFLSYIKSFMNKDNDKLNVIPYQREKHDLEISDASSL